MPNAAYTDPICEYGDPHYETKISGCGDSTSEGGDYVSEVATPVNAYIKVEEFLENKVVKQATLLVPFLDTEFTRYVMQEPEMRESLHEYLNHLHDEKYKVILYVGNKTEFEQALPKLSKGIKRKALDMTTFNTQSYMHYMSSLNKKAELGTPSHTKEVIAPLTHFPTQNSNINTVINGIVFLLFICMLRIVLKEDKKPAPRLRG